jgi:translation initiation factor IF-1
LPKEDAIEVIGAVVEKFKAGLFGVEIDSGKTVLAAMAGRLRRNRIKIMTGDRVSVELSPYDLTRGGSLTGTSKLPHSNHSLSAPQSHGRKGNNRFPSFASARRGSPQHSPAREPLRAAATPYSFYGSKPIISSTWQALRPSDNYLRHHRNRLVPEGDPEFLPYLVQ